MHSITSHKELKRHFSQGAVASLIAKVSGMGLTFLAMLVIARVLGIKEFGVYAYVWGWLGLISVAARFGFDTTVLRFVASYSAIGDWPRTMGILDYALKVTFVTALFGSLVLIVTVLFSERWSLGSQGIGFLIAAVILPISVRSSIFQSAIRALRHPGLADIPELIIRPMLAGGAVLLWFLLSDQDIDARYALLGQLFGVIIAATLASFIWRYCAAPGAGAAPLKDKRREWLTISLPLLLISAFQFVLHQMDIVMIGYIRGADEVGGYVPASRIADLVGFGLVVVSAMVAPMISSLYSCGDRAGLQSIVQLATRIASVFALLVFALIVVLRTWLLGMFGDGFLEGEVPMVILALGQLVNVLIGPVGYLTTMTGHHVAAGRVVAGSAILNFVLNLLLIPVWGVIGASIATASSLAVSHCFLGIYVWKKLKLNPTAIELCGKNRE